MNDKTKRIILITVCCLLCGAAVIGIAGRFGGNTVMRMIRFVLSFIDFPPFSDLSLDWTIPHLSA